MNPSGGYQSVLRLDDVDGVAKEEEKNEKKKPKTGCKFPKPSITRRKTWSHVVAITRRRERVSRGGGEERMENITQMSNYRRKQTRLWQSPEKSSDSFQLQSDLYDMIRTRQMFHRCSQTQ